MKNEQQLIKSSSPLIAQMFAIASIGGILFLLVSFILRAIGDLIDFDVSSFGNMIRLLVLLLVVLAILSVYANAQKIKYSLSPTSITVSRGTITGKKHQQIHRLSSVTSIVLEQSSLGSRLNFGNIILNIERLGKSEQIALRDIEHPDVILEDIRSKLRARSRS